MSFKRLDIYTNTFDSERQFIILEFYSVKTDWENDTKSDSHLSFSAAIPCKSYPTPEQHDPQAAYTHFSALISP